ncbi:MAG: hypothetical protein WBW61_09950 [Rhodanobacteraceae bacterium]
METSNQALILTGVLLPGFEAETAWPALANYFGIERERLDKRVLPRAPLAIKQGADADKLHALGSQIRAIGAEVQIVDVDDRSNLFVLLDNRARGPLPHAFVEEAVRRGDWLPSIDVAEAGSSDWKPWHVLNDESDAVESTPARHFDRSVEKPAADVSATRAEPGSAAEESQPDRAVPEQEVDQPATAPEPAAPSQVVESAVDPVPEPSMAEPEPSVSEPEPSVSGPEPSASEAEPSISEPDPSVSEPKPAEPALEAESEPTLAEPISDEVAAALKRDDVENADREESRDAEADLTMSPDADASPTEKESGPPADVGETQAMETPAAQADTASLAPTVQMESVQPAGPQTTILSVEDWAALGSGSPLRKQTAAQQDASHDNARQRAVADASSKRPEDYPSGATTIVEPANPGLWERIKRRIRRSRPS